jgi:hypothetical protein
VPLCPFAELVGGEGADELGLGAGCPSLVPEPHSRHCGEQSAMSSVSTLPLGAQLPLADAAAPKSPWPRLHLVPALWMWLPPIAVLACPPEQQRHVQQFAPQLLPGEHVALEHAVGQPAVPVVVAPRPSHRRGLR